jgi:hypothetical protein
LGIWIDRGRASDIPADFWSMDQVATMVKAAAVFF